MHTEKVPKAGADKNEFLRSDTMRTITLPPDEPLRSQVLILKEALTIDSREAVQKTCRIIVASLSQAYSVDKPAVRVLSVRPIEDSGKWAYELFGDYDTETAQMRLWMRTAVKKKPTSYGTLLSTLCHEFCHHLDVVALQFPNTFHTRGFYERAALLYHQLKNTPVRRIVWQPRRDGTFSVDWAKTMRSSG